MFGLAHRGSLPAKRGGTANTRTKATQRQGIGKTYSPIGDYAIVGDCRSAALVSVDGAVDWLCWPRFDSPSIFAALLDAERGGHFTIQPTAPHTSARRYLGATNVLETTFTTERGSVRLIDFMPVRGERDKRTELWPEHELLRLIEGVEGEVELEITCAPRPNYGRIRPRLRDRGTLGFYYEHGATALILRGDVPLALSREFTDVHGIVQIRGGERKSVSLVQSEGEPAALPQLGGAAERKLAVSRAWWEAWSDQCEYAGPYRDAVIRSALALKLLTFAPSGAVVAAPTTSLPEHIGGVRNWDYRYCWLRDASLTVQALFDLGYHPEAEAFLKWLIHSTKITRPELQILYNVYGESRLPERELEHLEGYAGSRPVRIGNDAHRQTQLDIYGEVVDSAHEFVSRGGTLDATTAALLVDFGKTVCRRWREADEGIWEIRSAAEQHTYSKAMCWVALDRLLKLHPVHLKAPVERFARERDAIREEIERRGFNQKLESYVNVFDGDQVDASLLLLGRLGYIDPTSPRMRSTLAAIEKRLGTDGLMYRYRGPDDGLPPGEGAFGICSFWAVSCHARAGDLPGAIRRFEDLLRYANDVGLYAEEIEPGSGAALGNFPQAFTHVGLIDAALTIEECVGGKQRPRADSAAAGSRAKI